MIPPGTSHRRRPRRRVEDRHRCPARSILPPQVLIRNRSLDGAPGYHILTPLRRPDGTAVLVVRGWVPLYVVEQHHPRRAPAADRDGDGRGPSPSHAEPRARWRRGDPADGMLTTMARVDIPRVQQQTPYPLAPAYVEMSASTPALAAGLPVLVPLPELDDGPHLGYAVQWIIFSICAIVGWFLLVRKSAKAREQRAALAAKEASESADTVPV